MATFNIAVGFKFSGEGSAAIQSEFKKLGLEAQNTFKKVQSSADTVANSLRFLWAGLAAMGVEKLFSRAIAEASQWQNELLLTERAVARLGKATDVTVAQLDAFAQQYSDAFAFADDAVLGSERALLRYGVTNAKVLQDSVKVSGDVARTLGVGIQEAAAMVGKALQEPGEGMKALKAAGLDLAEGIGPAAQNLAKFGHVADAQRLVLLSLQTETDGAALKFRQGFSGSMEAATVAMNKVYQAAGNEIAPALRDVTERFLGAGGSAEKFAKDVGGALAWVLRNIDTMAQGSKAALNALMGTIERAMSWLLKFSQLSTTIALATAKVVPGMGALVEPLEKLLADLTKSEQGFSQNADLAFDTAADSWLKAGDALVDASKKTRDHTSATDANTKALQAQIDAQKKEIDRLVAMGNAVGALDKLSRPMPIDFLPAKDFNPLEGFKPDADMERIKGYLDEFSSKTRNWGAEIEWVKSNWQKLGISEKQALAIMDGLAKESDRLKIKVSEISKEWVEFKKNAAENFLRGVQQSFADFFAGLATGGGNMLSKLGKSLKQLLIQSMAHWLAEWAVLQLKMLALSLARIAKEAAAQRAANAVGGGSGSGNSYASWASSIYKYGATKGWWGGAAGGSTVPASSIGGGSATGVSYTSSMYGSTFQTGATSSASSSGAAAGAAWAGAAFAAVVLIGMKQTADMKKRILYQTGAELNFANGQFSAAWGGKLKESGKGMAAALAQVANDLVSATGVFITAAQAAEVQIRNDKKLFMVKLADGTAQAFSTANEAILYAVRTTFLNSTFFGSLNVAVKQAIQSYSGDASKFGEAVAWVKSIADAASGLSDVALQLQNLPAKIAEVNAKLLEFGVRASEAASLSAQWGVQQFMSLRRSITGEQETPAQQLARKKQEATIFNAQLTMWRLEIQARIAYLKGQLGAAKAEVDINGSALRGRAAFVRGQGSLFKSEFSMFDSYLDGRSRFVGASAKIMQVELDALEAVLKSLKGLDINIGSIRLGGGKRGGRSGSAGSAANDNSLWDALLGSQSALSNEKQLQIALEHFRSLGKMDDKRSFASTLLGEAQGYYGNTAPYAQIYNEVIKSIGGAKFLTGTGEGDARKEATHQLLNLASAAEKVTSALLGTRRSRTASGTGGLTAAKTSSTDATLAAALTGLSGGDAYSPSAQSALGGSTQIVSAIQRSSQQNVSALQTFTEAVITSQQIQQRRQRAKSTTSGTYTPPPPPPPSGTTTIISGGGGAGSFERVA